MVELRATGVPDYQLVDIVKLLRDRRAAPVEGVGSRGALRIGNHAVAGVANPTCVVLRFGDAVDREGHVVHGSRRSAQREGLGLGEPAPLEAGGVLVGALRARRNRDAVLSCLLI